MKLTKTMMCAALGLSFQVAAADYIRLESGVNRDIYKLETEVKMTDSVAGIFSVEGNKETAGLEYNLATAYGKYRMPLSEKMSAELDFGLAYESMGDNYLVSHEFYVGYMGESGLEPYLMLEDMENEASYDVILGFYYRFD